jgi:hypothetical protein
MSELSILGYKLYGLKKFKELGLFNRNFVILNNVNTKEEIISILQNNGFKDNEDIGVRFSKDNVMNLPFFLNKYSLNEVAEIVLQNKHLATPFVQKLVYTKFSASIYYDGQIILIELYPGVDASKTKTFNQNSDLIEIYLNKLILSRYLQSRSTEDVFGNCYNNEPFTKEFLMEFAKKIINLKPKLDLLLKIQNPIMCDLNCESLNDINFMGMQKSDKIKYSFGIDDYFVVNSVYDLKNDTKKYPLFNIPISRSVMDWSEIISYLKKYDKVYVKAITSHLAIILREFGLNVQKLRNKSDYEVIEYNKIHL